MVTSVLCFAIGCGSADGGSGSDGGAGGTGGSAQQPNPQPTPAGTPTGAAETTTIGPEGGSLPSSDGRFEVSIPAGALDAATELSITPLENQAVGGVGTAYRIGPEGLALQAPVQIVFHYDAQDLMGTAASTLHVAFQDESGLWRRMASPAVDETRHTVTVSSPHFSDWSLVPGLSIRPPSATVQVSGTVGLEVTLCADQAPNVNDPNPPYVCDSDLAPLLPSSPQWAASAGVVTGSGSSATYQAPPQVPANNPVAVSATVTYGARQEILVSNILVKDQAPGYAFTISHKSGPPQEFDATITGNLELESKDSDGTYYTLSGNVVFSSDIVTSVVICQATGTPAAVSSNGASVLFVANDGTYTFSYSLGYSGPADCFDSSTQKQYTVSSFDVALNLFPGCPGMLTPFPITDPAHLQGSAQEGCVNSRATWSIEKP